MEYPTYEEAAEKMEALGKELDAVSKALEPSLNQIQQYGELTKAIGGMQKSLQNAQQNAVSNDPNRVIGAAGNAESVKAQVLRLKPYVDKAQGSFKKTLITFLTGLYLLADRVTRDTKKVASTYTMGPEIDRVLGYYKKGLGR